MVKRRGSLRFVPPISVVLLAAVSCRPPAEEPPAEEAEIWLFSEEEAAALRVPEQDWIILERPRGPSAGPEIIIEQPEVRQSPEGPTIEVVSPTDFSIRFERGEAGEPADLSTLAIVALRRTFPKGRHELTDKLSRYKTENRVRATGVKVPRGLYLVEISIADTRGVATNESYRLRVGR